MTQNHPNGGKGDFLFFRFLSFSFFPHFSLWRIGGQIECHKQGGTQLFFLFLKIFLILYFDNDSVIFTRL